MLLLLYKEKDIYGTNEKVTVKGFVFEDGKKSHQDMMIIKQN